MSTVLRPVGPRPPRVYWVRRLVVLGGFVLVLVGVWALVGALRPDAREPGAAASQESAAEQTGEQAAAGGDGAEPAVADGADALGACDPAGLTVTLATPVRAYADDQEPSFTVAVTNGGVACTLDVGSGALVVTVTSGSDRIWSSADCAPDEEPEKMLLLDAGAQHQETVAWDRTRSDTSCTPDLPAPRPGTYQAVATFHGAATEPAVFELR